MHFCISGKQCIQLETGLIKGLSIDIYIYKQTRTEREIPRRRANFFSQFYSENEQNKFLKLPMNEQLVADRFDYYYIYDRMRERVCILVFEKNFIENT